MYWEPFLLADNEGMLKDCLGNLLTITQYGSRWGVPYTIKPGYDSTTNSPKSTFVFVRDMDYYNRISFGNLGDNLEYCPAPGKESNRTKRTLLPPLNFHSHENGLIGYMPLLQRQM